MDNKVLDEAVEVAVRTFQSDMSIDENGCVGPHTKMRAALLAGMRVLLGEPLGWLAGGRFFDSENEACEQAYWTDFVVTPVYAPSLGEGDGR